MERARITVFDTTLRDGEQSPGCSMNVHEKLRMAHQLDRLGVDVIEAGFPIASDGDFEAVEAIAASIRRPVIAGLARACARGWHDAITNPQAVIASLAKAEPLAKADIELERLNWLIKNQIRSADVEAGGLGTLNPAKLARGIDQVAEAFGLPAKPAIGDIYTEAYLPPVDVRKL